MVGPNDDRYGDRFFSLLMLMTQIIAPCFSPLRQRGGIPLTEGVFVSYPGRTSKRRRNPHDADYWRRCGQVSVVPEEVISASLWPQSCCRQRSPIWRKGWAM